MLQTTMAAININGNNLLNSCTNGSQSNGGYYNELEEVPDDILMELMARFGQTIMRARNDLEK